MKIFTSLILVFGLSVFSGGKGWNLFSSFKKHIQQTNTKTLNEFYWKAKTNKKIVAISFDDGPINNTVQIMNYLKKEKIPASFFCIASQLNSTNVKWFNDPLFELGLHTFTHSDYRKLNYEAKKKDIENCIQRVEKLGVRSKVSYFRPAYGLMSDDLAKILKQKQLKGVLWSVDSQDWNGFKQKKLTDHVINSVDAGSVVLFHDRVSMADLKVICEGIRKRGFEIVPLSEMIKNYPSEIPVF